MAHKTEIGKDILEMLMFSLYPEAETIYREYLQNATDAIREACEAGVLESMDDGHVTIQIRQPQHSVVIQDNGIGIPANLAESTLKDIAKTKKRNKEYLAGYYGIGRLVGAGYCRELVFETSSKGEPLESKMVFNVDKIRDILEDEENDIGAAEVIDAAATFSQTTVNEEEHYFRVTLNDILVEYPELLDETYIRDYLKQIAPIDYLAEFKNSLVKPSISENGDDYLPLYNQMNRVKVSLNDYVDIRKPYGLRVDGTGDQIYELRFFKIDSDKHESLAWGWYAITEFSTQIPDRDPNNNNLVLTRGMRLRIHNIQIGSQNFFDGTGYFKQARSNKYFNGEIHIVHPRIKPTTDRSDLAPTAEALEFKEKIRAFFNYEMQDVYQTANKVKKQLERYETATGIIASSYSTPAGIPGPSASAELAKKLSEAQRDQDKASDEIRKQFDAPRAQKPGVKAMLDVYQQKMNQIREEAEAHVLEEPTVPYGSGRTDWPMPKPTVTEEMEAMTDKYGSDGVGMLKKVFSLIDRHTPTRSKEVVSTIKAAVLNDLKNE